MPRDIELDRLKATLDAAFDCKQAAWAVQDQAWNRLQAARGTMSSAYEAKQSAYGVQQSAWEELQSTRGRLNPRIDALSAQQESAYQRMSSAFDSASSAHAAHDGAAAKSYATEGHAYKAESQAAVAERRQLIDEIRGYQARHDATKPAFQRAKGEFDRAKAEFDRRKADSERAKAAFQAAKHDFDKAKQAFDARCKVVQAASRQRKADKRALAQQAGVPAQYLDDVWVTEKPDGTIHFYFGGVGEPAGPGHAHYVMDASGHVTYRRDPYDPHGAHNFTDAQQDYFDVIVAEASRDGDFGFMCLFRGLEAHVESNINRQGRAKIDIYYGPNGPFGPGHHHAVAYRDSPLEFIADEIRSSN